MVWVFERTGSLLVAILMHAPLSASQFIFIPMTISGIHVLVYDLVFAAVLWLMVIAVALINRGKPGKDIYDFSLQRSA